MDSGYHVWKVELLPLMSAWLFTSLQAGFSLDLHFNSWWMFVPKGIPLFHLADPWDSLPLFQFSANPGKTEVIVTWERSKSSRSPPGYWASCLQSEIWRLITKGQPKTFCCLRESSTWGRDQGGMAKNTKQVILATEVRNLQILCLTLISK